MGEAETRTEQRVQRACGQQVGALDLKDKPQPPGGGTQWGLSPGLQGGGSNQPLQVCEQVAFKVRPSLEMVTSSTVSEAFSFPPSCVELVVEGLIQMQRNSISYNPLHFGLLEGMEKLISNTQL